MTDKRFLTPEEVSDRYRGEVTVGTLRNWRAMRIGPAFLKVGMAVLYPVDGLDAWDKAHTVTCDSKVVAKMDTELSGLVR